MFACLECGRKFKTVKAAEKAANDGCPKCGGVDVDVSAFDLSPPVKALRYHVTGAIERGEKQAIVEHPRDGLEPYPGQVHRDGI